MSEDYALFILKREQQIISRDTQLQGPGPQFQGLPVDPRNIQLDSLGKAIDLIEKSNKKQ